MDIATKAHELMAAVGPALDLFAVDEYQAEGMWHIAMDEQTLLFAEIDKRRNLLVLSAAIGVPAGKDRLALYERLLHYNHLWDATGGMRLSIDAPEGVVWLLADVAIENADTQAFGDRLTHFADKIAVWREIVAKTGTVAARPEASPADMQTMIRG